MEGMDSPHTVRCSAPGCPAETVITVREYHPAHRNFVLTERGWSAPIVGQAIKNLCPAHARNRRN